jgi:hypothetical protein
MTIFQRASLAAVAAATLALAAAPASAAVRVGSLECNVSAGVGMVITSSRGLACVFRPTRGAPEHYYGTIRRFGLDIGATGPGKLAWAVFAPSRPGPGALAGDYAGASGSVSVGIGLGANALVGGLNNSFALQPLSVEAQTGANIAAGVGALRLESAGPAPASHRATHRRHHR